MGHGRYIEPPKGQYQVQSGEKLELQYVILPGESRDLEISIDLDGPGAEAHIKVLYLCKASVCWASGATTMVPSKRTSARPPAIPLMSWVLWQPGAL